MSLKENLTHGHDYYLIELSPWMGLISAFGGAPEICFTYNDFNPFKIRTFLIEGEEAPRPNTYLISERANIKTFERQAAEKMELGQKGTTIRSTYVVRGNLGPGQELIEELKPDKTMKSFGDFGVTKGDLLVMFSNDMSHQSQQKLATNA